MSIDPRRWPTLVAVTSLLAGIALNVAIGSGAEALTGPLGTAGALSPDTASASSPTPTDTTTPAPLGTPTPTPTPTPLPEPSATSLSRTSGGTAALETVSMRGTALANVKRIVVGSEEGQRLTLVSPTELRFVVPEAADFVPGTVPISLVSATDGAWISTSLTWTYAVRSAVDREMAYAATHWGLHTSTRFGYIPGNDCVNFTSQLLAARGWHQSAQWWNDGPVTHTVLTKKTVLVPTKVTVTPVVKGTAAVKATVKPVAGKIATTAPATTAPGKTGPGKTVKTVFKKVVKTVKKVVTTVDASATWVSSTAMSTWLASRPDLATRLSYGQRAAVQVGDIVQFNWSGTGSWWDHTAVVSRIVVEPNGTQDIWYAEHTNHQLYGGSIGGLRTVPGYTHMRVQFWHLKH